MIQLFRPLGAQKNAASAVKIQPQASITTHNVSLGTGSITNAPASIISEGTVGRYPTIPYGIEGHCPEDPVEGEIAYVNAIHPYLCDETGLEKKDRKSNSEKHPDSGHNRIGSGMCAERNLVQDLKNETEPG